MFLMKRTGPTIDKYIIVVNCVNCGWQGEIAIKTGRTVGSAVCPNCGCHTLMQKIWWRF